MDWSNCKKIGAQVLREFWVPLLVTPAWVSYVMWGESFEIKKLLETAGTTFFLVSWFTGQFFRIRKQEHVQSGLGSIEQRVEGVVAQLEETAKAVASYATGGDSFCYVAAGVDKGSNATMLTVVHEGKYPMYAVTARIVDLAKFQAACQAGNPFASDIIKQVGDMAERQAKLLGTLDLGTGNACDLDVHFSARNGFYIQQLRFRRINGEWEQATCISTTMDPGKRLHESVSANYPRDAEGRPVGLEHAWPAFPAAV